MISEKFGAFFQPSDTSTVEKVFDIVYIEQPFVFHCNHVYDIIEKYNEYINK